MELEHVGSGYCHELMLKGILFSHVLKSQSHNSSFWQQHFVPSEVFKDKIQGTYVMERIGQFSKSTSKFFPYLSDSLSNSLALV